MKANRNVFEVVEIVVKKVKWAWNKNNEKKKKMISPIMQAMPPSPRINIYPIKLRPSMFFITLQSFFHLYNN